MNYERPRVNPWDLGDYPRLSARLEPAAVAVAARAGAGRGRFALDVAAGDGSVASALSQQAWHVYATDASDRMVELGRARTGGSDGVAWRQADLAHQPFDDASMDVVVSSFGLIFGEDPAECVSEVARVLNPAGRLLFTAWVEDGYMAEMTRRMMAFFPDAPVTGPMRWGSESFIAAQLAPHFLGVEVERLGLPWAFPSAREGRKHLESASPAHVAACAALGDRAEEMMDAVEAHLEEYVRADGSVEVEAEYWLVDAQRIP